MKTRTLIVLILFPFLIHGQSFDWANMAGGSGSDQAYAISTDASGNSYVTGWFSESAHFGDIVLNSEGGKDVFIAKYNSNGEVLWAKKAWGTANNTAAGICIDASGNAYITGWFAGAIHFGEIIIESHFETYDMFVAKYSAEGVPLWARLAGGEGDDYGNRLCLNAEGDVLIAGSFRYTAHFGEDATVQSEGDRDIFIANYSSEGNFHWVKRAGGKGEDRAYGIVSDAEGNSYYTGVFNGKAFFGDHDIQSTSFLSTFIAKINPAGETIWVRKGGGGANDYARGFGLALNSEGYIISCGYFSGKLTFGEQDIFASGGEYDFDSYWVKYDHEGGFQYLSQGGGYGMDQALDVVTDQHGFSYVTGFFSNEVHFGDLVLESQGKADVFVVKYNWAGEAVWVKRAGGNYLDYAYGISIDAEGALYLCGVFQEEAAFDDHVLEGVGGMDMFVSKLLNGSDFINEQGGVPVPIKPNPNKGSFEIELPYNMPAASIYIYDLSGKKVFQKQVGSTEKSVNFSLDLPSGSYILSIPENRSQQLLIIQ